MFIPFVSQPFPAAKADLIYLRILKQAASGLESDVAQALTLLLADQDQNLWDEKNIIELTSVTTIPQGIPVLVPQVVNLSIYDQFLLTAASHVSA